ncbi:NADH-quinone oxidoreductase subunit L [Acidihalobacter ferrooxydans]|uniref:NADH-quinone oxidoreductase subunit L n=1 Tax=Acidihalobacter ferrooxydans TaxID=1765967 RepID=A0A1P8UJ33_9GAMM|nr:NADH-quinone oxidoreductase subunit L [Acidihalobacter ferrooxydans]APZ43855.1 NADH-quinone oxidoreductase subunit L [Acidihalobacter ferrooxydans]
MEAVYLAIPLAPLFGALVAGLFGSKIGKVGAHSAAILGVFVAFALSVWVFVRMVFQGMPSYEGDVYTWMVAGDYHFAIGFLIDRLTVLMMVVVTFVSLMVHIYTIGYMGHDETLWPDDSQVRSTTYQRFFSYIALFTFSMLMLVMANNLLQLFFGWEAVGLVSYLLIGFYMNRESAIYANLKAFLVNRVGDFGFLLGIAAIYAYTGTLNYHEIFAQAPKLATATISIFPGTEWSLPTVIAILLFIGAMGKSAQVPLHVWLPDSMEGPTPISALIHAATMVTAGIFMVTRMSPIYELSETALSVMLIIGSITAFFMGLIGIVQNDIKRVIAYSTLSQLGYMTAALGASAFAAGMFHLMTHAFFKALLFLAAGSVIMAMHHEQDIRKMGGLRKYMPITYWTSLIGSLALIGFPGFSGFFSKESIIGAVEASQIPGAHFAAVMLILGVFVTALYTFRLFFLVYHGEERMDAHTRAHLHESPKVVTVPLILLAIATVGAGGVAYPLLFGSFFGNSIYVAPQYDVLAVLGEHFHGLLSFTLHGLAQPPFWLALAGVAVAWDVTLYRSKLGLHVHSRLGWVRTVLEKGYGFDAFNDAVFAAGSRGLGRLLWRLGDALLIDGLVVNGTARLIGWTAARVRWVQTGYLYHYSFAMIIGVLVLLSWFVLR